MSRDGNPGWYFAPTLGSPADGLNDSSREHFEGAHEKYLTREIIQNSLDAKDPDLGGDTPVKVVFELRKSKLSDITGLGEMRGILEKAKEFSKDQEGAGDYYDSALKAVSQDDILVLRVGDYNTKGLDGADDDTGGNWNRLILAEGVSSKKGDGGGSYGIGKNAAFVASALRTNYYVSRNGSNELVFAGKAKISSFEEDGEVRRGAGQYGNVVEGKPYISSIRGDGNIADYFKREERGTDIYVAGYLPSNPEDWRSKLIEAVLADFWAAIYFGNLVVELKDGHTADEIIDASSLETYLEEYKDSYDKAYDNALPYYLALVNEKPVVKELKHIGEVKLYVRVGEDMPRRIAMMRKPKMVVQKKQIQALNENYAGVLVCDNDKGNDVLRKLEPPAHDRWEHTKSGKRWSPALLELESFLRETLRAMNPNFSTLAEDVPGLSRYLWDIEERDDLQAFNAMKGENTTDTTDSESPREVGAVGEGSKLPTPVKTQVMTIVGGGGGGTGPKPPGPGPGPRPKPGPSPGPHPQIGSESFDFRSFVQRKDGEIVYQVILKPLRDAKGSIKLLTVGEDGEFPADVVSVIDGTGKSYDVEDSMVNGVKLAKGNNLNLSIKLDSKRRYVLGVESHEL